MPITYSQSMLIGTIAPDFSLPDTVSGEMFSLERLRSTRATVVMFLSNHCPFVQHIAAEVAKLAMEYEEKGVSFVGISANDISAYPADGPEEMKKQAEALGYSFPYLYDASQEVAKSYGAECTPEFYVFDADLSCTYHGRFDAATPGKAIPVTGEDLRHALDATLAGLPVTEQHPSMGCNIKWRK